MNWAEQSVFYQIYPLGACGAPQHPDGETVNRIGRVRTWIPHLKKLGVNAVYFGPVFESDCHGYDTRDYRTIDPRLGTNADFKEVCDALHEAGIRVVLDGVFNHVGRGFWAFKDVLQNKENSRYKDWFHLSFQGRSNYGDPFWYQGWEGCFDLVKLNLQNPEVTGYLTDCIRFWESEFGIDGLRLDVAYSLEPDFLKKLHYECAAIREDFWLCGECLHGDYNRFVNAEMLQSCTNYECYKGLYSALNSRNLFEICHSLNRQFSGDPWALYRGKHLMCFADNHDVTRLASILGNPRHLAVAYGILFGMPGIPCLYYGSEWGMKGEKKDGDWSLRPEVTEPEWNVNCVWISKLAKAHRESPALTGGSFRNIHLANTSCVFERACETERILVAVNADAAECRGYGEFNAAGGTDLLTGQEVSFAGGIPMAGYSVQFIRVPVI